MPPSMPADPGPRWPDRVAVITGGAGGIGEWITRRFAAAGAVVVVNDIAEDRLDEVSASCTAAGGDVHGGTLAASGWYRSRTGRGWSVFPN